VTRRETEEYEALARVSPGATLIHRDGVILHANEPALTLFGIENRANMVGTRFLDYVHPLSKADMIESITTAAVGAASVPRRPATGTSLTTPLWLFGRRTSRRHSPLFAAWRDPGSRICARTSLSIPTNWTAVCRWSSWWM
jgi:PAS domain-containing protein